MILKGRWWKTSQPCYSLVVSTVFTLCVSFPDPFCMHKQIAGVALSQPSPSPLDRKVFLHFSVSSMSSRIRT